MSTSVCPTGSRDEPFNIDVVSLTDDPECAAQGCACSIQQELTLELRADIRGMVAAFGTVGFCSPECAQSFVTGTPYYREGADELLFVSRPVLATATLGGHDVAHGLGHDPTEAAERVFAALDEHPDPDTFDTLYDLDRYQLSFKRLGDA